MHHVRVTDILVKRMVTRDGDEVEWGSKLGRGWLQHSCLGHELIPHFGLPTLDIFSIGMLAFSHALACCLLKTGDILLHDLIHGNKV